jgi:hypothetical protein
MQTDVSGSQATTRPAAVRAAGVRLLVPTSRRRAAHAAAPLRHSRGRDLGDYPFCCQAVRRFRGRRAYWKEVSDGLRLQVAPIVSLCRILRTTGEAQPASGGVEPR